jgi:long-chain-fatty-acid--[acyl-carrier-protein] ligase
MALDACIKNLSEGGNVLLYPSGRTSYTAREEIGGASAVETIIRACPDARIVLVRIKGLWGSRFSRSAGTRPSFGAELKKGALIVLSNLLFSRRAGVSA